MKYTQYAHTGGTSIGDVTTVNNLTSSGTVIAKQMKETEVQAIGNAADTIEDDTAYVNLNADVSEARVITMPAAIKGKNFRVFFSVEQDTDSRVFTRAGSDTFDGMIVSYVQASGDGAVDALEIPNTTVTITTLGDTNLGSYIDFFCMADGRWSVVGHLIISAVGKIPTLA